MTEAEWWDRASPDDIKKYLHRKVSQRKAMLFAVAAFRRLSYLLPDAWQLEGIDHLEQCAEGRAVNDESRRIIQGVRQAWPTTPELREPGTTDASQVALMLYRALVSRDSVSQAISAAAGTTDGDQELRAQCHLLRDIVGNPFRPVAIDPAWLTSNVVSLAQTIYDERRFDHLPILGDALEEAGCQSEHILLHCRAGDKHWRGCWLIDLLLERA